MATQAPLSEDRESLLRSKRRQDLPEEERGLVYWEEWCQDEGYGTMPTWETLLLFVRNFVAPMEERLIRLATQNPSGAPIVSSRIFIEPVLNLRCSRKHSTLSNSASRSSQSDLEESPCSLPQRTTQEISPGDLRDAVALSSFSSSASETDIQSFASAGQPHTIHSQVSCQENGRHSYLDEQFSSADFAHMLCSSSSSDASTVVASAGSDVVLLPPPIYNDHVYHDYHRQDHFKQHHDQRQLKLGNEPSNNNPQLYSRFNFLEFKFVPAAYSCTPRKATLPGLPEYGFRAEVKTTEDVLQEWRFGYKGRPAIQDLNNVYPSRWWEDQAQVEFENRWMIVWEFVRLCGEKNLTSMEAVEVLEELRGDTGSLQKLVDAIRAQHLYGLTTNARIWQAGPSSMIAEEDKYHSESVLQNGRTDLGHRDDLPDPRLCHGLSELEVDHMQECETNHVHQDLALDDGRSGFEVWPTPPYSETGNNRAAPLAKQHSRAVHERHDQFRIQKRKPVYRFESDTEDESEYALETKGKKTKRKNGAETKKSSRIDDTRVKRKYSRQKIPLEDENTPFPLPVRNNLAISDIWKEWTVGWEGEPSMEHLIATHGRIWTTMRRHHNHFVYRCRIVRVIHAGLRVGAVASEEEACAEMEKLRETPDCNPLRLTIKHQFKELVRKWGADKVSEQDIIPRKRRY